MSAGVGRTPRRKIVFVAPFGLRHKTTVWARTLPLAQQLAALGHRTAILIPPWDSPEDAGASWSEGGVPMHHVRVDGGAAPTTARLLRAIGALNPDIVHIVKPRAHAGLVQWALWQKARIGLGPLLVLDADDWEQAWAAVNAYPPHVARFLAWQEEWGLRHAHGLTLASRWLEARATAMAPAIARLYLPNGITLPAASSGASHTHHAGAAHLHAPPTVLYFTRFAEVQPAWLAGFVQALAAMAPGTRLVVAGASVQPGGERPFREVIARLHDVPLSTRNDGAPESFSVRGSSVHFLGAVAKPALPGLYAASTLAIFPAHAEPLQEAKCSVRLASTLLAGVPVVASAVGEQQHYGADGSACLLPAEATPQAFAGAVAALLAAPEERGAMVARARAHLTAHYQWPQLAAHLDAYYTHLLTTHNLDARTQ